ncbi:MAG TPA: 16S rRNA (cytosine(1402)-N(4))-methyltransferase RsmH [Bacillota bacterium]|nr:16S rRNA (cytosine(1402)-N(4))-methyltransferase RsmH [Bacillota bacterium]
MTPEYQHRPVLLAETIQYLKINPAGIYVDATIGGAGHASQIAGLLSSDGLLIGIDQDQNAIAAARERLKNTVPKVELIRRNFVYIADILKELNLSAVDGILFDLGVSSPQLDMEERGFSYKNDAPLDMRMDQTQPFSAAHLVNTAPVDELAKILWDYGEERFGKRIATLIDQYRREREIKTTGELAEIIKRAIPAATRRTGPHPAKRSFQALRIAVNHELEFLRSGLEQALSLLKPGGRLVVISFHSLEDRIVKGSFTEWSQGCKCPRNIPVCICHQKPRVTVVTKKAVFPSPEEVSGNPRAHSARLRAVEKI